MAGWLRVLLTHSCNSVAILTLVWYKNTGQFRPVFLLGDSMSRHYSGSDFEDPPVGVVRSVFNKPEHIVGAGISFNPGIEHKIRIFDLEAFQHAHHGALAVTRMPDGTPAIFGYADDAEDFEEAQQRVDEFGETAMGMLRTKLDIVKCRLADAP